LVFLLLAVLAGFLGPIQDGTWTRVVPTYPLVMLAKTSFGMTRTDLRNEIETRVNNGSVRGRSARELSAILAKDLRNDGIWGSAFDARAMLTSLWPDSMAALENETMVGDGQSKVLATQLLRAHSKTPSEIVLVSCVADLHDDGDEDGWEMMEGNAADAAVYLLRWWNLSSRYVRGAMLSSDVQQQFLAATVAGFAGCDEEKERIVEILFPYILDNNFRGDAKIAAPAMYHVGPNVIPLLQRKLSVADEQAEQIILHIIERLENPDRSYDQCNHRMPRLTGSAVDPLEAPLRILLHNFWFWK